MDRPTTLSKDAQLELLRNTVEAYQKSFQVTQNQYGAGVVARGDVLQAEADPNQCFLYEAYRSKEDVVHHQQTPHYLKWKETVATWMAMPRQGVRYLSRFPGIEGWE